MFRDGQRAVALVAISIRGAELDVEKLGLRAEEGGTTMTELADRLVRDHDIPFSKAHAMAAGFLSGDATAISSKYTEEELCAHHQREELHRGSPDTGRSRTR